MKLRVLPEAAARIDVARAWWRENRERAPHLLDEELIEALEQIQHAPGTGQRISLSRGRAVRRILLPKTWSPPHPSARWKHAARSAWFGGRSTAGELTATLTRRG